MDAVTGAFAPFEDGQTQVWPFEGEHPGLILTGTSATDRLGPRSRSFRRKKGTEPCTRSQDDGFSRWSACLGL